MVQYSRIFLGVLILIFTISSFASKSKKSLPLLTHQQLLVMNPEMQSRYVAQLIEMAIELEEKSGHKIGTVDPSLWEILFPTLEAQVQVRDYGRGCSPGYDRRWINGPCFQIFDGLPCPEGYSKDREDRCVKYQNADCGPGHYQGVGPNAPPVRGMGGRPPDYQRSCTVIEDVPNSSRTLEASRSRGGGAQAAEPPRTAPSSGAAITESFTLTPGGSTRTAEAGQPTATLTPPAPPAPTPDPPALPAPVQIAPPPPPPPAVVQAEARSCLRASTTCDGEEADPDKHRDFVGSGARNCINAGLVLRINPRSRLCPIQQWARYGGRTYTCGGRETLCNPLLFGTHSANRGICVPISNQTTRTCLARSRALAVAGDHKSVLNEPGSRVQEDWNDWMTQIRGMCEPGTPPGVYHCRECEIIAQHVVLASRDLANFDRENCTFRAGTSATPNRPSSTRR